MHRRDTGRLRGLRVSPQSDPSHAALVAAQNLKVDVITAEVVAALHESGVPAVLLKGPSIARWLYDDHERAYQDTDLLISARDRDEAERTITGLGFEARTEEIAENRPRVSRGWFRRADAAAVDLHWGLEGVKATPDDLWRAIERRPRTDLEVRGQLVRVLDRPALLMHVALHAAQHGSSVAQVMTDLDRATEIATPEEWSAAADLARDLDAYGAFATGLALSEKGRHLADDLGLEPPVDIEAALTASSLPEDTLSVALGIHWLRSRSGMMGKLRFLRHKILPSRAWMVEHDRIAGRGPAGLAFAHVRRWMWILRRLPRAILVWSRIWRGMRDAR